MNVLSVELRKLARRPALWWSVVAGALMSALFGYIIPYAISRSGGTGGRGGGRRGPGSGYTVPLETLLPTGFVDNAISGFPLFYFAIALVLGALSAGNEYRWGTIRSSLVRGPGRAAFLGSKLVALVVLVVPIVVASFGASWLSSVVIAVMEDAAATPPTVLEILRAFGGAWLILAVGAALGVLGGVVVRDTGPVIGGGLVYVFIVEQFVAGFAPQSDPVEAVATALPGINAGSLAGALAGATPGGPSSPGVNRLFEQGQALAVLVVWLVVAVVAALVLFQRRDVTS